MSFHDLPLKQKIVGFIFGIIVIFIIILVVNSGSILKGQEIAQEKGELQSGETVLLNKIIDTGNSKIIVYYPEKVYPTISGINPSYIWDFDIIIKHISGIEALVDYAETKTQKGNIVIDSDRDSSVWKIIRDGGQEKLGYRCYEPVSAETCTYCDAHVFMTISGEDDNHNEFKVQTETILVPP